jgi:hypothetical protein
MGIREDIGSRILNYPRDNLGPPPIPLIARTGGVRGKMEIGKKYGRGM